MYEKTINGLQDEIKKLVDTINNVTLRQNQARETKQKMFENKKITELEEEIYRITDVLQNTKSNEIDLTRQLSDSKALLKEKDLEISKLKKLIGNSLDSDKKTELQKLKNELSELKESYKIFKKDIEHKESMLNVEMLGKVEQIASAYEQVFFFL